MVIQKLVGRIKQGNCWNVPIENLTCCAIINIYQCCLVHIQIDRTVNTSPCKAQPCIGDRSKNSPKRALAVLKCLKHFSRQYGELQLLTSDFLFLLFTVCSVVPLKASSSCQSFIMLDPAQIYKEMYLEMLVPWHFYDKIKR